MQRLPSTMATREEQEGPTRSGRETRTSSSTKHNEVVFSSLFSPWADFAPPPLRSRGRRSRCAGSTGLADQPSENKPVGESPSWSTSAAGRAVPLLLLLLLDTRATVFLDEQGERQNHCLASRQYYSSRSRRRRRKSLLLSSPIPTCRECKNAEVEPATTLVDGEHTQARAHTPIKRRRRRPSFEGRVGGGSTTARKVVPTPTTRHPPHLVARPRREPNDLIRDRTQRASSLTSPNGSLSSSAHL
jgi:hypothetical protein